MHRPSNKELFGKSRDARASVQQGRLFLIDQDVIAESAIELGYDIGSELQQVLTGLLRETTVNHYTGSRPPQKSYKQEIEGVELFAFAVRSRRFSCKVYYKFALIEGIFWLVSLHQDRPRKKSI
jgi:hypothetical protein